MDFPKKCKLALTMGNLLRSKKYGGYSPSIAMSMAWDYVEQLQELEHSLFIIKFYSASAKREVTKVAIFLPTEEPHLQNYLDAVLECKGENSFRRFKRDLRVA
jgi:hypothetical protein